MVRSRGEGPARVTRTCCRRPCRTSGVRSGSPASGPSSPSPRRPAGPGWRTPSLEALESGGVGQQHDRIATLRTLRAYANSLGLPGDDYVLVAVEQWPSLGHRLPTTTGDTAVVPVVSISSAPAGGPLAGRGMRLGAGPGMPQGWPMPPRRCRSGRVRPRDRHRRCDDTGQVPVVDTGRGPAVVDSRAPQTAQGHSSGFVAFLVVLGAAALVEHDHVNGWATTSGRTRPPTGTTTPSLALGITSTPAGTPSGHQHEATTSTTAPRPTDDRQGHHEGRVPGVRGHSTSPPRRSPSRSWPSTGPCWVSGRRAGQPDAALRAGSAGGPEPQLHGHQLPDRRNGQRGRAGLRLQGLQVDRSTTSRPRRPFTMTFNAAG